MVGMLLQTRMDRAHHMGNAGLDQLTAGGRMSEANTTECPKCQSQDSERSKLIPGFRYCRDCGAVYAVSKATRS